MAYGLKYQQFIERDGSRALIRIYAKDWEGRAYGMAHITGAALQIVGGTSDLLTPAIKTAFSFSLVDAWDEGTTQADGTTCVNARMEKCGEWEEFFTPDATKYKVEVAAAAPGGLPEVIWTGFVTPDSWSEDLIYHGSVTITARDMLGALQESEFNLSGRVSVLDIVAGALSACSCPMPLTYNAGHFLAHSSGVSLLHHNFVASTFAGDNWWTALTETLESLGLVLRWNGRNEVVLTSLRYLAADTQDGYHPMEFVNRSGLRSLDPAMKQVTEIFDIDYIDYCPPDPAAGQFTATGSTITSAVSTASGVVKAYNLTRAGDEGWAGTLAIPMYGTPAEGLAPRGMYVVCAHTGSGYYVEYKNPRLTGRFSFKIALDGGLVLVADGNSANARFSYKTGFTIGAVSVLVMCTASGTTYYLNSSGVWVTTETTLSLGIDEDVQVPVHNGGSDYRIRITRVSIETNGYRPAAPIVAPLLLDIARGESTQETTEYKTTMIYNAGNNVTITRQPKIGSALVSGDMDFYGNVLAYDDACVSDAWNWPGEESFYPLAVMIQAQVVCFYSAPASVFTGTAHDKAYPGLFAIPGWGLDYYDRECLIVSATYDFSAGLIAQMYAREVYGWEDVWGESFAPEYTTKQGIGTGSTSDTGRFGGGAVSTPAGAFGLDFSDDFSVTNQ